MLVKLLWVSMFKMLVHPALLPIALATFISVAGPGGFAEIGYDMTAAPTIAVVPESPPIVSDEHPPALLVRVVHEETPAVAAPAVEPDVPKLAEIEDESLGAADEAPPDEAPTIIEVPAQTTQPAAGVPSADDDEPIVDPSTPEEPVEDPADGGSADDGAGDVGDDGDPQEDDDTGSGDPPEDDPDAGEDTPDDGADDGSDGTDEAECDPPGTGPEPHDGVPPGHDQNEDGIDDRCQENEGDGQDPGDEGADDSVTGDGSTSNDDAGDVGAGDGAVDQAECDPPGNGHDNHGTPPPGHDKDEDGIDDRCQDADGAAAGGDRGDDRKNNDDG